MMNFFRLIAILATISCTFCVNAQIVTSQPPILQQSSEGVVIYYHADMGNKALINQPASQPIYAHTGVITNLSTSSSDWKHAPQWLTNTDKYKMEYVSDNLWKLNIGNIDSFYGIAANETVTQLAFVFRNADGSKQGKTASGGDIFLNVVSNGLQVTLSCDLEGSIISSTNNTVNFKIAATQPANLSLSINNSEVASLPNASILESAYTFTATGTYSIKATASVGETTVTDEITLTYPDAAQAKPYPGGIPQMGCVRNPDGSVNFCIAAPLKSAAIIVGSWDDYKILSSNTMYYHDYNGYRYFWITIPNLSNSEMYLYYFLIDGISVSDPYAKLVLDPTNDKYISADVYPNLPQYPASKLQDPNVPLAIYQGNLNDYNWKVPEFHGVDKSNLIIYELLVRDFTGTEGKALGDGTIRKAMTKLNYLKQLGVNAIELLPINEFQGNISWGYNPNFYFAPDKAYGTPDDYKAFIDECHQLGIAVILDIVFNQTDWLHPWYQLYPVGSNPFYNASAPHAYSVLNDWNQGHPLVQKQFQDCLQYWLKEYKVDGFRFDLVKGLGNNESYTNSGDAATNAYNKSRIQRMITLHQAVKEIKPDAYFINEDLATPEEENEMAQDGQLNWANINHQGSQFAMGYNSDSDLRPFYAPYDQNRIWGSTVSYLESHDEQRLAYLQNTSGASGVKGNIQASMARLGSAAAQMILAPGAHMIWQFSELGNYDNTKTATGGNNVDPKTVRWNLFDNEYRKGLYNSYSELITIRNANPDLFTQNASFIDLCADANWANGRFLTSAANGKEIICIINPDISTQKTFAVNFQSKNNDDYHIISKTYNTNPTFNATASSATVAPNSYVVIASKGVVSVPSTNADNLYPISVIGLKGEIAICGSYSHADVFNLNGQKFSNSNLPTGLYIVRVDGRPFKVIVK